ncbi:MAG: helix-turn-helix transcriptional regulator [Methanobrevibacter sp.]|uniref:AraC family transcriptional regulator n=1 Tax=Methanobrevibacter sp. TaxID=66852 RepID=UPI0025E4E263|nr:AraC family transcriptional regulator [Methanobrevibacter sp.]MBR0270862.1 helix-turn-helix transcriptional regulator [Methanobrevibacter sp.]
MNENLYGLFENVFVTDYALIGGDDNKTIDLGQYGKLETYSLFPGIVIAFIDINLEHYDDIYVEEKLPSRLLEINHCLSGRYSYSVDDDKIIYFGKGDLCISIYELTKTVSDFPLGFYKGLEIFIDIDVANDHIKNYIPDFDLIEFYESLEKSNGYVLIRSNEKIDHVIGELYNVENRIKLPYYKLKCLELLLFFSITNFTTSDNISLSKKQVKIVEMVKNDLMLNLESKITIDELSDKYNISKTTLKNCFKEVYGKPIYKWRKEYRLDYACKLIDEGSHSISDISRMVGYSSPSKFSQAFKDYVGCTPSDYRK